MVLNQLLMTSPELEEEEEEGGGGLPLVFLSSLSPLVSSRAESTMIGYQIPDRNESAAVSKVKLTLQILYNY